ncbi:NAD(P)-dependent oxidoreductase [Phyllobacterium endophyticum]|uniref:dihydrouracil dehydrogenase (NAD(+)) n=1 Tax=Phyllobacterium endophyticum TaxID=1149773 RepID=A0A2P7AZG1_9HYPH|nr:NAD(P)-dependent oxidoreductase [Phyllobacterium endophyticum]MBB3235781.1 glutamate synthase (NADPH/NADH) small chain [Phyllobacterium endophyticum]PSH59617.1 dihydropyrimidine dehydrogenase [Phyllobacterium endophyticum]TYR41757.1 NAD(P)-dependent oxidoreductase [Phyllobacterium endophyticum]
MGPMDSGIRDVRAERLASGAYADVFSDLHPPLSRHEAFVESDRCYFCYDAPCMNACPTGIDIPLFIREIAADNPTGSAKTILSENILGGMCARVCPTETLCEQACVREAAEGKPVKIGLLQRYATDHLMANGQHPFDRAEPTGKSVAIVGAGPAGLSAAHRLAMRGHDVTIFEARPKAGGLNEYGIAAYKSVADFAQKELDFVLDIGGITIHNDKALGRDISLDALKTGFDAVFLGMGLPGVNELGLDGEDAAGCIDAVDFISVLRQSDDLSQIAVGRDVVVIGGGMTAIDVAVQTKLLGAENVIIAYRRGPEHMNASDFEQELALKNGVIIRHWLQPRALTRNDRGEVCGITLDYTNMADGRLSPSGESITLASDQVFKAIGQTPAEAVLTGAGIALSRGRVSVDDEGRTSVPGIWAGGDCVAGGQDLTVAAVQDGKIAAESIHRTLMQQPEKVSGFVEAVMTTSADGTPLPEHRTIHTIQVVG